MRILIALSSLAWLTTACQPQTAERRDAWPSAAPVTGYSLADTAFARLVRELSEPGGFFDTDNLISNETSYLHVLGPLARAGVSGGAYIGVGPDQNFSYLAQVRPRIAFILDIRRDNLLQHLWFKALFARSRDRAEYLGAMLGRPLPTNPKRWRSASIAELVAALDSARVRRELVLRSRPRLHERIRGFGVPVSDEELAVIDRIHDAFVEAGLDLKFTSRGRPARFYYPTYRELLVERDLDGRQANYLATEDAFQFVRSLQLRNLVVPVVGDFAGPHALAAIGREIAARGERVSAFYTSNVEMYLMRAGSFDRFANHVASLPRDDRSVIIRSYFGGPMRTPHPQGVPGYASTQLLHTLEAFATRHAAGGFSSYLDLVIDGARNPQ